MANRLPVQRVNRGLRPASRSPWLRLVAVALLPVGCAPVQAPPGRPPPAVERIIPVGAHPDAAARHFAAPGLTHLLRGLTFLTGGHAGAAVPHLRLALMYDHDSPFIYEKLSYAWGATGERDRAQRSLDVGLAKNPQAPGLNRLAGQLALRAGSYAQAIEHLRIATASDDEAALAGASLVDALLWHSETAAAEDVALRLIDRMPSDLGVALRVGGALEDHERLPLALRIYERAQQQHPSERAVATSRARVLDLVGRAPEAIDGLISLFRFYPDAPEVFIEITRLLRRLGSADADTYRQEALRYSRGDPRGQTLVAAGDLLEGRDDLGIPLLQQTVAAYPVFSQARLYLAEAAAQRGNTAVCLQALMPRPGAADPFHRARFGCYAASGRAHEAITELNLAAAAGDSPRELLLALATHLAPTVDEARVRGEVAALRDRFADQLPADDVAIAEAQLDDRFGPGGRALDQIRAVHEDNPRDPRLTLRLADLEARYGDPQRAINMLADLVRQDPYDPVELNALGFTLAEQRQRLTEAAVWLRRAYRLSSDDGFVIDSLGWLMYQQGRHAEALRLLQRAARVSVRDPEILRHLGDTYRALGRHADARKSYSAALLAHPIASLRAMIEQRLTEYAASPGSS